MNDILSEKDGRAIEDILIRTLDVQPSQLTPDAKIMEDLGADSLDVVEITMAVEEQFDLSVPEDRVDRLKTVGDLHEAVAELLQEQRRR